ncbi:hypothetical protein FV242_33685 [Methylobacterium sp. WL64]|uniref:hypothetical protein n=1 Tax=Methylobacterium sp. WL64 TaxID=2603894 RepID=UPI0011C883CF|nr:hypothetical protein [Methylobacterium sp. WL64]TXM96396.1 hypothetical protein FV242_33685 [Methylobacterium sp. WL64]
MSALFDMACPACGSADRIDIAATVWVRVTPDGTDPDNAENGDHEFTPASPAMCSGCGHRGTVAEFDPD